MEVAQLELEWKSSQLLFEEGDLEILSSYTLGGIGRHETLWLFESTLDWLFCHIDCVPLCLS